ncbi:phosphate acyltransferase [Mangrovibacterium sp.]|uniref:phosphate acyltransferase n=1 Tax=Mangrovibacterium sp. TaxID=1961364 RepID=UPI0035669395
MTICNKAKQNPKKVVFADANNLKMLKAAHFVVDQGIAQPILLGNRIEIEKLLEDNKLVLEGVPIIDIYRDVTDEKRQQFAQILFEKRKRKGLSYDEALEKMYNHDYFGCMMVETGEADAFISGFSRKYADTIRPAIHVIGTKKEFNHIAGMYIMLTQKGPLFLADTTVNSDPAPQVIADTTVLVANEVKRFKIEPRIAVLSYSNFGAFKGKGSPVRASEAVKILHQNYPDLIVDGEMQANYALNGALRQKKFPFTKLGDSDANVLIFPNLSSGNILYKVLQELGAAKALGPILLGMNKPIHVLQMESSVREIANLVAVAVVDAQEAEKK